MDTAFMGLTSSRVSRTPGDYRLNVVPLNPFPADQLWSGHTFQREGHFRATRSNLPRRSNRPGPSAGRIPVRRAHESAW
ncbi:MAG: hypothetical protein QOG75_5407 [Mycobacterium sp.]|jgi:hypothetical protein|nr:hypothetical protein [Mycobacterium sp.]